jgi:hypothetical protein
MYREIWPPERKFERTYRKSIAKKKTPFSVNERTLGTSYADAAKFIECNFEPGMTWGNKGDGVWNIDHIIPLSSFNLKNEQHFILANHYCNLRPLWKKDNEYKGSKYPSQHMLDTILNKQF